MTTSAVPTSLQAWRHQLRARTSSVIAVTAAVATILAGWQVAVIVGNRVPSLGDTFDRLAAEQSAGELWHQSPSAQTDSCSASPWRWSSVPRWAC